jgi:RNA polymerase sigma-70 factor (ECF subfamily)
VVEPAGGWDLVRAAQQGDRNAFASLYGRYVGVVFRFVLSRVGDRSLAEDLTSETFLHALRGIGSVRNQGSDVGAWLVRIARNLVLDHVKSSRYRKERLTEEVAHLTSGVVAGPEDVVVAAVVAATRSAEVMRCVAWLTAAERQCVLLRFWQGCSVTETAAVMGRSVGAVKACQHRAVRRMARLAEPSLARDGDGGGC